MQLSWITFIIVDALCRISDSRILIYAVAKVIISGLSFVLDASSVLWDDSKLLKSKRV